jgi:hypothetical protein
LRADLEIPVAWFPSKLNRMRPGKISSVIAFISELTTQNFTNVIAQAYESGGVPFIVGIRPNHGCAFRTVPVLLNVRCKRYCAVAVPKSMYREDSSGA